VYTLNVWSCAVPDGQDSSCPQVLGPGERRWPRLSETHRFDMPFTSSFGMEAVTTNVAWDSYGNLVESTTGGTGSESVTTHTDYVTNERAYIVDRPMHVEVSGADGRLLEAKWFTYDNATLGTVAVGNVTAVYSWLDQVPLGGAAATLACPSGTAKC